MTTRRAWFSALFALLLVAAASAQSQEVPRSSAERAMIALLARVSFNEALDSYEDLALIWQVTEGHGETLRARYAWLERHSPCVSGRLTQDEAYLRPGNCRWSRNLEPDGRQPRGWDRALHGRWGWIRDRWLAHVPRARAFVMGEDTYRPCSITPQSWDGGRWREQILERGHTYIDCGGHNVGVCWEGDCS